jgi:hypothetical protein
MSNCFVGEVLANDNYFARGILVTWITGLSKFYSQSSRYFVVSPHLNYSAGPRLS